MSRGAKVEVECRCGCKFMARVADRNRGWARFCSKSCKAKEQEKRTGQYGVYKHGSDFASYDDLGDPMFYGGPFDNTQHQNSGD